jgi:hypothetical protein
MASKKMGSYFTSDAVAKTVETHISEESPEMAYRRIERPLIAERVYLQTGLRVPENWQLQPLIARVLEPHGYWGEAPLSMLASNLEPSPACDVSCTRQREVE